MAGLEAGSFLRGPKVCGYLSAARVRTRPGRGSPDRENKGGEVHQHGEPSRDRLEDNGRPGLCEGYDGGLLGLEPLGQLHRYIHICKAERDMEETVAVDRLNPFVPQNVLAPVLFLQLGRS